MVTVVTGCKQAQISGFRYKFVAVEMMYSCEYAISFLHPMLVLFN